MAKFEITPLSEEFRWGELDPYLDPPEGFFEGMPEYESDELIRDLLRLIEAGYRVVFNTFYPRDQHDADNDTPLKAYCRRHAYETSRANGHEPLYAGKGISHIMVFCRAEVPRHSYDTETGERSPLSASSRVEVFSLGDRPNRDPMEGFEFIAGSPGDIPDDLLAALQSFSKGRNARRRQPNPSAFEDHFDNPMDKPEMSEKILAALSGNTLPNGNRVFMFNFSNPTDGVRDDPFKARIREETLKRMQLEGKRPRGMAIVEVEVQPNSDSESSAKDIAGALRSLAQEPLLRGELESTARNVMIDAAIQVWTNLVNRPELQPVVKVLRFLGKILEVAGKVGSKLRSFGEYLATFVAVYIALVIALLTGFGFIPMLFAFQILGIREWNILSLLAPFGWATLFIANWLFGVIYNTQIKAAVHTRVNLEVSSKGIKRHHNTTLRFISPAWLNRLPMNLTVASGIKARIWSRVAILDIRIWWMRNVGTFRQILDAFADREFAELAIEPHEALPVGVRLSARLGLWIRREVELMADAMLNLDHRTQLLLNGNTHPRFYVFLARLSVWLEKLEKNQKL